MPVPITPTFIFIREMPDSEESKGSMPAEETKAPVLKASDMLFNKHDYAKAAEF